MTAPRIVPKARPQLDRPTAVKLLAQNGVSVSRAPALLGLRGYYTRTMGDPATNDRAIYDDAIVLVAPNTFATFNANTDPSKYEEGIASLVPGVWTYKLGIHGLTRPLAQRYEALVQADDVTVLRDGGKRETGWFGINIHRGGKYGTSSLGCQTIVPSQWEDFLSLVKLAMKAADVTRIVYVLRNAP